MNFRMYAKVKMKRPIDKNADYISPGGYVIKSNSKEYKFDFMDYEGVVDDEDKSTIHLYMKNPDCDSFPDIKKITTETLHNISEFIEFFVYTGEVDESDLRPVELLECQFRIIDTEENIVLSEDVCKKSTVSSCIGW